MPLLYILTRLREVNTNLQKVHETHLELKHELKNVRQENQELRLSVKTALQKFRQRNLILRGLQDEETENEGDLLNKLLKIIYKITNSKEIQIDTVARLGSFEPSLNRLVRIIFVSVDDRNFVFNCRNKIYLPLVISEDVISGNYGDGNNFDNMGTLSSIDCFGDLEEFDKKFGLTKDDFELDFEGELGRGQFGRVYKGHCKGVEVAIKKPQLSFCRNAIRSLLAELKVHSHIRGGYYVVAFVGAYVKEIRNDVLYVATEICIGGSLKDYLRSKKRVRTVHTATDDRSDLEIFYHDLARFAMEIAKGLEFIGSRNVVHGDLSTRNILLDSKFSCKICDFGLSRMMRENDDDDSHAQLPKPWKWMAYEALANNELSYASDIWSLGVTIWEIFSLGDLPYAGLGWTTGFLHELKNGLRLQCPQFAPEHVHSKLMKCWNLVPKDRPTAGDVGLFFENICTADYSQLES